MLIEQTLATLHALKLSGMATALDEQRGVPDLAALSFDERLALLLARAHAVRHDTRLTRLVQLAPPNPGSRVRSGRARVGRAAPCATCACRGS